MSDWFGRGWSANGDFLTFAIYSRRPISPTRGPPVSCAISLSTARSSSSRTVAFRISWATSSERWPRAIPCSPQAWSTSGARCSAIRFSLADGAAIPRPVGLNPARTIAAVVERMATYRLSS